MHTYITGQCHNRVSLCLFVSVMLVCVCACMYAVFVAKHRDLDGA